MRNVTARNSFGTALTLYAVWCSYTVFSSTARTAADGQIQAGAVDDGPVPYLLDGYRGIMKKGYGESLQ